MNFFKSSFLSDLKLQDVLALSRDTPGESETLISSTKEDIASSSAENLHVSHSGMQSSSNPQSTASSDVVVCTGSGTPFSSSTDQEEEGTGIWNIGSLVKSITSKSEGILQAYRKDLEEFGSGLKKETQLIAEVAAHAVKDLPTSLETGAYMAQESIESVGQVVDEFSSSVWRGTADLIAQGKEAVLSIDEDEGSVPAGSVSSPSSTSRYDSTIPVSGGKYSRFEAQVRAMQHDISTYCDEPGDFDDYTEWKSTFSLTDQKQDIDTLVGENNFFQELVARFVPEVVSEDVFWTRYFYRLQKLQKTEEARADLVKRASALEEEDLSWDTEEELDDVVHTEQFTGTTVGDSGKVSDIHEPAVEEVQADESKVLVDKVTGLVVASHIDISDTPVSKNMSKDLVEEEEDLGWEVPEVVEEFSRNDGKRSSNSEASWEVPDVPKEEIRKMPTAQEDEEDLSWDVDDGADEIK